MPKPGSPRRALPVMIAAATLFLKSRWESAPCVVVGSLVLPVVLVGGTLVVAPPPPLSQAETEAARSAARARARKTRTPIGCRRPRAARRSSCGVGLGRSGDGLEHLVEPDACRFLVEPLRVHELAREDLLGLHEHLLLAGRKALLLIPEGQVPNDLGQLEDVAGLHLVPVVLEAAIPVLRHLRSTAVQDLEHLLDHVFVDHLAEPDSLCVLRGHVDGHVVVQDLDGQVLALLPQNGPFLLFHHGASAVMGINDLIADFVQALLLFGPKKSRAKCLRNPAIVSEMGLKRQVSRAFVPYCGHFAT